jgi:uncharacterized membrane protein YbhN (UPF0104 family)
MPVLPRWVSARYGRRGDVLLAAFLLVAVLLEVMAGAGLSYVAGFYRVRAVLRDVDWTWLAALAAALVASFTGYYYAYRGIFRVGGGPKLPGPQLRALVAAGFGGFLSQGSGSLDRRALEAAGADQSDAKGRLAALAGMEQGVLALGGCAAAIAVLVYGLQRPPLNTSLPWAVVPVPGLVIAFWLATRYRERFRGLRGWRGWLGTFLYSVYLIREIFLHPRHWWFAVAGMAVFWVAEAFAVWAGIAAFGYKMNVFALFVGFATGMVFTRRTGPLAGAGILALALTITIHYSGAPFAVAIVGVFCYRIAALWLPMPVSLAVLPTLRKMAEKQAVLSADTAARSADVAVTSLQRAGQPGDPAGQPGDGAGQPGDGAAQPAGQPGDPAGQAAQPAAQAGRGAGQAGQRAGQ